MQQGRTPLIAASDSGFADIVKLLVHKISNFPDEERQKYLDQKKHVCQHRINFFINITHA